MSLIKKIIAREVYDSRGNPTVEVELTTKDGTFRSIVPSGASTGIHEALELRDKKGSVKPAIDNINKIISKKLKNKDTRKQEELDNLMIELDGTDNKSKLGANAILACSMAICKAGAASKKLPLYKHISKLAKNKTFKMPIPSFNVINGGKHAGNKLAMQEFMIQPIKAKSFREAMQMGTEVYHELKTLIKNKYGQSSINVGDEGGFAPDLESGDEALKLLNKAINNCKYKNKIKIAMDVAASEFKEKNMYNLNFKGKTPNLKTKKEMIKLYQKYIKKYNVISIEDPFDQDDFDTHHEFTEKVKIQVVGDDLLVTNPLRIEIAHFYTACNALLLKINQIGSISEAIKAANLAKSYNWNIMVSHRSGETEDTFIADLAVGINAEQIKSGAPCRSERISKYNQLLRIEEKLK